MFQTMLESLRMILTLLPEKYVILFKVKVFFLCACQCKHSKQRMMHSRVSKLTKATLSYIKPQYMMSLVSIFFRVTSDFHQQWWLFNSEDNTTNDTTIPGFFSPKKDKNPIKTN